MSRVSRSPRVSLLRHCHHLKQLTRSEGGESLNFRIKKTTKMSKVLETYAQRQGVAATSIRFLLDGHRVPADKTADEVGLHDGEQLDLVVEQHGGC